MTYLPRPSVCYPHSVQPSPLQRSSDDDDPSSRSPPLEVSDEECMRDHITSTTGGEHGKEMANICLYLLNRQKPPSQTLYMDTSQPLHNLRHGIKIAMICGKCKKAIQNNK